MKKWKVISFSLLLIVSMGIMLLSPRRIDACSSCPSSSILVALFTPDSSVLASFNGHCNILEKNYCVEYMGHIDMNTQSSFCKLMKGTFKQDGKCSQENFIGKCKVSVISSKFYYSSFTLATAKADCEKVSGTFSESFN